MKVPRAKLKLPRADLRLPRANLRVPRANLRVPRANLSIQLVAQRQDEVSDTLALLICKLVNVFIKVNLSESRAAAPKGTKSCRTQGRISIRPSIPPPRAQLGPLKAQLTN